MIALVQESFHTTLASLFELELEPNSLDWNGNKLEHQDELEDIKHTIISLEGSGHKMLGFIQGHSGV